MSTKASHLMKNTVKTVFLALATMIFIASCASNQPVIVTENTTPSPFSNALEMQYAQPWIDAQNEPAVVYGNSLELQYAQPWLEEASLLIAVTGSEASLDCHNSLEMLYACKYGYGLP